MHPTEKEKEARRQALRKNNTGGLTESESVADGGMPGKKPIRRKVEMFVVSHTFDSLVCLMIVLNASFIGAEVDYQVRNPTSQVPNIYLAFEYGFFAVFSLELLLRIYAFRLHFFNMAGFGWNIFDSMLVILQVLDVSISTLDVSDSVGGGDSNNLRIFRMLRLVRVMRVLRVCHINDELRKLLYLISGSFSSFLWTGVLLLLLTYIFAVLFTQLVADYAAQNLDEFVEGSPLHTYFGSTGDAINSLYKAITGGADWADISVPLEENISIWLGLIFALYVAFGALVLLNLVTGVFVEGAHRMNKQDKHWECVKRVRKAFQGSDDDRSGSITELEFNRNFEKPEMQELFGLMEINGTAAHELFALLDLDENGTLTDLEFVAGAMQLQNPAKAIDVLMNAREQSKQMDSISTNLEMMENKLEALLREVGSAHY
jgi:voltage-gated sodium channel